MSEELRKLDAEVAEKVFGQPLTSLCSTFKQSRCDGEVRTVCGACGRHGHGNCYGNGTGQIQTRCEDACLAPYYSSDISAAMEVVEKMRERGFVVGMFGDRIDWCAEVFRLVEHYDSIGKEMIGVARHTSLPEAICRAALAAHGR